MTNNMTYENLLDAYDSFEAYLLAVAKKFDDDIWVKAHTKKTIQAYEHYLNTLPNGIHKQDARKNISKIKRQQEEDEAAKERNKQQLELEKQIKLDEVSWLKAHAENTIKAYEHYLNAFRNAIHKQEARVCINKIKSRINEERAENEKLKSRVKEERAENERQKALQIHEREKQLKFDESLWLEAKKKNTIESYQYYLNTLPNGIHKQEAVESIKKITRSSFMIIAMVISLLPSAAISGWLGDWLGIPYNLRYVMWVPMVVSMGFLIGNAMLFFQSSRK